MKRLMVFLAVLAATVPAAAQEFDLPPGKWWEDQRLASRIGLSEDQQQQIREVIYERARRMIDLKADVDKAGLDLRAAVDQQQFDPAPVRAAYAVFQTARHKLEVERFEMLLEIRQILTYEQWQQIEEIKRRIQQNRPEQRRPGPGGQRPSAERPPSY